MNNSQRKVLKYFIATISAVILFPPFHVKGIGFERNLGHAFLLDAGHSGGTVDVALVFTELFFAVAIFAALFFYFKDKADDSEKLSNSIPDHPPVQKNHDEWTANQKPSGLTKKEGITEEITSEIIIRGFREHANQNGCAPTAKTSDKEIINIYKMISSEFQAAAKHRGENLNTGKLNNIALYFIQTREMHDHEIMEKHLKHEIETYKNSGLRMSYDRELKLF